MKIKTKNESSTFNEEDFRIVLDAQLSKYEMTAEEWSKLCSIFDAAGIDITLNRIVGVPTVPLTERSLSLKLTSANAELKLGFSEVIQLALMFEFITANEAGEVTFNKATSEATSEVKK